MIDVTVKITAIIMYCDESILNLELGNGYTIEKCYYDDFPFKSEIENGKNQLCIEYIGSRLHDENGSYFICLKKEDVFSIDGPQIVPGAVITDKTCQCEDEIGAYQEQEVQYLHKIFSLLRLYKNGNIGLYQTFFNYRFKVLGFINNTHDGIQCALGVAIAAEGFSLVIVAPQIPLTVPSTLRLLDEVFG